MNKVRWLQFDLRTLLVLVLVLAVPLGWHQYAQMRERRRARKLEAANAITTTGGRIRYEVRDGQLDLNSVREVELARGATNEAIQLVSRFSEVRRLILRGTFLTDSGLAGVTKLKRLEFLDLVGTDVTDEGIQQLQRLPVLQELALDHTGLTDDAVEALSRVPGLRSLSVRGTHITEQGARELEAKNPGIEVAWATAPSEARRRLAALLEQGGLVIEAERIDDNSTIYAATIEPRSARWFELALHGAAALQVTGLRLRPHGSRLHLTKEECELLANCVSLKELRVEQAHFDTKSLAGLTSLISLEFARCIVADEHLADCAVLSQLQALTIVRPDGILHSVGDTYDRFCRVTDEGLAHLKKLTNLRRLALRYMAATEGNVAFAKRWNQTVEDLQISDAGLAHLASLEKLESLDLSGSPVTAAGILKLRELKKLRELILVDVPVTAEQRVELQEAFPRADVVFERPAGWQPGGHRRAGELR